MDILVQDFARDVQLLLDIGALMPIDIEPVGMPSNLAEAEGLAERTRARLDPPPGPLPALDAAFEVLGLCVAVVPLGDEGAGDGAYIPLEGPRSPSSTATCRRGAVATRSHTNLGITSWVTNT